MSPPSTASTRPGACARSLGEVVAEARRLLDVAVLVGRGQDHNRARDERKHGDGHDGRQSVYCFRCVRLCSSCSPPAADFTRSATATARRRTMTWVCRGDLAGAPDLYGVPPGSDLSTSARRRLPRADAARRRREPVSNGDSGGGRVARVSLAGGSRRSSARRCAARASSARSRWPSPAARQAHRRRHLRRALRRRPGDRHRQVVQAQPRQRERLAAVRRVLACRARRGTPYVAVAWGPDFGISGAGISWVEVYDADGNAATGRARGASRARAARPAAQPLDPQHDGATPTAPAHFLALDGVNDVAALDVNPWASPPTKTHVHRHLSEPLSSVYAVSRRRQGALRLVRQRRRPAAPSSGRSTTARAPATSAARSAARATAPPSCTSCPIRRRPTATSRCATAPPSTHAPWCAPTTCAAAPCPRRHAFGAQSRLSRLGIVQ